MASEHHLPPNAACLSESLRDLGYSLETAIADLVDNSISAEASVIRIYCDISAEQPLVAIIDDGRGMLEDELVEAMRHGPVNPELKRAPNDLGRFGLGLKTASFSQCKRLTVASVKNSSKSAAEWNLSVVAERNEWVISVLSKNEINSLPYADEIGTRGTLVVWRDLDRLLEGHTGNRLSEIVNDKLDVVEKHLSLVFHRFLAGEVKGRKRISIVLNGHPVEPFDPFCRKNSATQAMPEEVLRLNNQDIRMCPFILPHHSRLTEPEYRFYQDRSDFISNQGAYIYRNGRLMAWGDWFRLIPKGESTKLARVQIDFPSALDKAWTIDIKKSRARPPHQVRERLRHILTKISARSIVVHRGRGEKLYNENFAPLWNRYADRKSIRYEVNTDHPAIKAFKDRLDNNRQKQMETILQFVSASLPLERIYSDYSTDPVDMKKERFDETLLEAKLDTLKTLLFPNNSFDGKTFRKITYSTGLFENANDLVEKFIVENS